LRGAAVRRAVEICEEEGRELRSVAGEWKSGEM